MTKKPIELNGHALSEMQVAILKRVLRQEEKFQLDLAEKYLGENEDWHEQHINCAESVLEMIDMLID